MDLLSNYDHDWQALKDHRKFDPGTPSLYCRAGLDNMPFRNNILDRLDMAPPYYDPNFTQTFSQVTDSRCFDLWQTRFDRPWVIYWSGGIDSTVVVSSILKNLPKSMRENISIACNRGSIAEYPWFYFEYIEPNFQVIDSSISVDSQDQSCYSINGDPADQLFAGSISQSMLLDDSTMMNKNLMSDPDSLLSYIEKLTSKRFSHWYYERIVENIQSINVPVITYHDFFWWTFFNHSWISTKMRVLHLSSWGKLGNANPCFDRFINWFDTEDYQKWSMVSNIHDKKYGKDLGAYKQAAKDYIYSINKDAYYQKFKTKTSSGSHYTDVQPWICMLDDLSLLTLDDIDLVLELLPDHINR